jgi:hypothetical protein
LTDDEIESIVSQAVSDARDFIESEIAPERTKAQEYFDGKVEIGSEEGRSRVVSTKLRDTVRRVKPSLMRIFMSSAAPVEFVPSGPEDVMMAEQATRYVSQKVEGLGFFNVLRDVTEDAMVKKVGFVKVYRSEEEKVDIYTFSGLDDDQFTAVVSDPDVEVLEHTQELIGEAMIGPDGMQQMQQSTHDVKVARVTRSGQYRIDPVPPEEWFIDRNARSIDDAYVHGHSTDMRVGDLVAMGFDFDMVADLGTDGDNSAADNEDYTRRNYSTDDDEIENSADPSMKLVTVTEAYMKIDVDGTGRPALHRIILGGSAYKLLSYDAVDESPFVDFQIDPVPHSFWGRSMYDVLKEDQDAATSVLRGILDNVAMVNNPGVEVVRGRVLMDDLLNNEIGRVVRVDAPGMIRELTTPFVAGQTLTALQYIDNMVEEKTGVTRASSGLDPDALQSTTKAAVTATIQAAAGQVEVIARNLAEGGVSKLFGKLLRLYIKHCDKAEMMRVNGTYYPVDARVWDANMNIAVNVGLGTGREEEKMMALQMIMAKQETLLQTLGMQNPLVTLTQYRNTLADLLAASGLRNSERYLQPMNPQIEQQLAQQQAAAAQNQQPQPDPQAQAFLQAEQMKAQVKMQSDQQRAQLDMQKAQADHQLRMIEMQSNQDLQRDKMAQDLALSNTELFAKYGIKAGEALIKAEQNAPRGPNGAIVGGGY